MTLYHGSYKEIEKPNLSFSRLKTDFGKGFYTTPIKTQAQNWARRFLREYNNKAVISIFEFSDNKLTPDIKILEYDNHNIDWLNFITGCRLGQSIDINWDLVIGGVANDKVFDTLQLYFDGLIRADEAIGRLRFNKPNLQYCFKSQDLINKYLKYTGSEALT